MRLKDIIRAPKTDIIVGGWKTGRITRSEFPLSKARAGAYRFSAANRWCVIRFSTLGNEFRVLVQLREGQETYRAMLGVVVNGDIKVLCSYEFHGTHAGWHCHLTCESDATVPAGVLRGPWVRRFPGGGKFHRHREFHVTKDTGKRVALRFYRVEVRGSLV